MPWNQPSTLRHCLFLIVGLLLAHPVVDVAARAPAPSIAAHAAVVMDVATGRVLYARNPHERMYPASITKIMTAAVALERGQLDALVKITPEMVRVEGSSMYLLPGQEFTLEELLYGLIMVSGNDAGVAVAHHIAGSVEDFARLMNDTARRIGATNTHFVNPHGLPHADHYTTAYDMALITRYALSFPALRAIASTRVKEIPSRPGRPTRQLRSGNWLLGEAGVDGVKTGYTRAARHTYVASATRDGHQVVAVLLRTDPKAQKWSDARELIDYAFTAYRWHSVAVAGQLRSLVAVEDGTLPRVPVVAGHDLSVPLLPGEEGRLRVEERFAERMMAPMDAGAPAGQIDVYLGDPPGQQFLASVAVVSAASVAGRPPTLWERIRGFLARLGDDRRIRPGFLRAVLRLPAGLCLRPCASP